MNWCFSDRVFWAAPWNMTFINSFIKEGVLFAGQYSRHWRWVKHSPFPWKSHNLYYIGKYISDNITGAQRNGKWYNYL